MAATKMEKKKTKKKNKCAQFEMSLQYYLWKSYYQIFRKFTPFSSL